MKTILPTLRFSDRVADYERWRPGYPAELVPWLIAHCGLRRADAVADVGAGTGLFAHDLLAAGLRVMAVEPNTPMREAAERRFSGHPNFVSCAGRAEAMELAAGSVDLITAAQAFHWFDPAPARAEFLRVLRPHGQVALIWNVRRVDTPFLQAYEELLLKWAPEYAERGIPQHADEARIESFFANADIRRKRIEYVQQFDCEGLRGRLRSSSYVPAPGQVGHAEIVEACSALFAKHARGGVVDFSYDTQLFVGRPIEVSADLDQNWRPSFSLSDRL